MIAFIFSIYRLAGKMYFSAPMADPVAAKFRKKHPNERNFCFPS